MSDNEIAIPRDAVDAVARADWITVFTGAGISADSGIPTFRAAKTGLWEHFDQTDLATPDAWEADPALVWGWYSWRARLVRDAQPNAGHLALPQLGAAGAAGGGSDRAVMVVTQNVDDLHERAGTPVLSHLHGSLFEPRCSRCARPFTAADANPTDPSSELDRALHQLPEDTEIDLAMATDLLRITPPSCPACGALVRPGIVWFGEPLPTDSWDRAESAFRAAEVVIVVGTSGIVYPAAALPERAAAAGIPVIEINPEPSAITPRAAHRISAGAARGLPALVEAVRAGR